MPHQYWSALRVLTYSIPALEKLTMPKHSRNCHTGLDQRCRDESGAIRRKDGATLVGTLRDIYGDNFAPGVRSDMKLDTLLDQMGADSLTEVVKNRGRA